MKRILPVLDRVSRRVVGLVLCGALALLVAIVSAPRPWRGLVPFGFVFIILLLSARYGMLVSLFGSVTAALIFAYFLYSPLGSFRVASESERGNLGWMMLSSIAIAYLLLPTDPRQNKHR
jgi:K+-sensing histidine kinase KdpD